MKERLRTTLGQDILDKFKNVIDFVLTSTHHPVNDEKKRYLVVNSIQQSIRMSQMRNPGKGNTDPEKTEIYRLARILKDSRTWDEYRKRAESAFPKHGAEKMLTRFGVDWKTKFELPKDVEERLYGKGAGTSRRRRIPPDVVITKPEQPDSLHAVVQKIEGLEQALAERDERINTLEKALADTKELFSKHAHIGNKLYVEYK